MKQIRRPPSHRSSAPQRRPERSRHVAPASAPEPAAGPNAIVAGHADGYELAPVAFYVLDRQGRILELNEMGAKLLGFPKDWLVGRPFVVFITRDYVRSFLDLLTQGGRAHDPQSRTVDLNMNIANRFYPVQISFSTSTIRGVVRHQVIVVDVTHSLEKEGLLRESLANWYSLVQNAPDIIMTVEPNGRISFVNKPAWGYSIVALRGSNIVEHVPEADQPAIQQCLKEAFRENRRGTCELRGVHGDLDSWYQFSFGSPYPLSVDIPSGTKRARTTTLLIRDISEHKRMEEILRTSGEQMRDFAARLERVREEERTRVAREIHDELGQALTVLKLDLSWLQSKPRSDAETRSKLKETMAQVDDTIDRVRRIASELRPSILDNLGLVAAIEWQGAEFQKHSGIRTRFVSNVDAIDLPIDTSVAAFRVVQEALTNIMRHARATRVELKVDFQKDALRVSIRDNGIGLTLNGLSDLKSLGLVGMKERLARIGGQFNLTSRPGHGTRITLVLPLGKAAE